MRIPSAATGADGRSGELSDRDRAGNSVRGLWGPSEPCGGGFQILGPVFWILHYDERSEFAGKARGFVARGCGVDPKHFHDYSHLCIGEAGTLIFINQSPGFVYVTEED